MKALIIVDLQNDFIDGSLAVPKAEEIIDPINDIMENDYYDLIIATQDWHPRDHISFASTFDMKPFEEYNGIIVWPEHCIAGTEGAEITNKLDKTKIHAKLRKGYNRNIDAYSVFGDNEGNVSYFHKMLEPYKYIHVCGLATDYCVYHTLISGKNLLPNNEFQLIDFASKYVNENNREIIERTLKSFNIHIRRKL